MAEDNPASAGPDLEKGIALSALTDGTLADGGILAGHVGGKPVLLVRRGDDVFAIGAECTHYGAPLADGLVVGDTIRCPWHHACFSLHDGAAKAPALAPLPCWQVERRGDRIIVGAQKPAATAAPAATPEVEKEVKKIVIVGGGAAGFAAAQRLRDLGYRGALTILSQDQDPPVDRPNLSKDYLAGQADPAWMPLREPDFYSENAITLRLAAEATALDTAARMVHLADGGTLAYDRLLLATGAEPVRLPVPGAELAHVCTLRSFADCRAIIALAATARRVVVVGASFIGLEAAAALRARDLEVHVVAPEQRPMERILGAGLGDAIRALHEQHGVVFHLQDTVRAIDTGAVHLASGMEIPADLVIVGIGVRPRLHLAESAHLAIDRGVTVNAFLETSVAGIFAAGDIARWPDPLSGTAIRAEHWAVAQRQGQTAAANMLGRRVPHRDIPFFWSRHYDLQINYSGHAEGWDAIEIEGDVAAHDCLLRYQRDGKTLAVATIGRDRDSLAAEAAMERRIMTGQVQP